ncbi:hypothetical protein V5O48_017916, partial [Marasmius crinis-equi]
VAVDCAEEERLLKESEDARKRAAEITARLQQYASDGEDLSSGVDEVPDLSRRPSATKSDDDGEKMLSQQQRGRELRQELQGPPQPQQKCPLSESSDSDVNRHLQKGQVEHFALKTGGITKAWQSRKTPSHRQYQSDASQGDKEGLGGLTSADERGGLDEEIAAVVAVCAGLAAQKSAKKNRDIEKTQLLSTLVTFIGTKAEIWDVHSSQDFVQCLEACYHHFFPNVIEKRPTLLPITAKSPEYIVFFANWKKPELKVNVKIKDPTVTNPEKSTTPATEAPETNAEHNPQEQQSDANCSEEGNTCDDQGGDADPRNEQDKTWDVSGNIPDLNINVETVGGRVEYIQTMLDHKTHLFIYTNPEERAGAFESELILKTYATYYSHYTASVWNFGVHPASAMALATTAQTGSKGKAEEFGADIWQKKTAMYYQHASRITEDTWDRIEATAAHYSKKAGKSKQLSLSDGKVVDGGLTDDDDNSAKIVVGL